MKLRLVLALVATLSALAVGTTHGLAAGAATPSPGSSPTPKAPTCAALAVHAPNTLSGLKVTNENPCATFLEARGDRALDAVALLAIRQNDNLLIATLEVGRFKPSAPIGDSAFQSGVVDSIGDALPQVLSVGSDTVYTSSSPGLVLISWIRGRYLYVLAVRVTYGFPKALLRDALKVRG